jgi:hypothetical protein
VVAANVVTRPAAVTRAMIAAIRRIELNLMVILLTRSPSTVTW